MTSRPAAGKKIVKQNRYRLSTGQPPKSPRRTPRARNLGLKPVQAPPAADPQPDEIAVKLLPLAKALAAQIRERLPRHADYQELHAEGVLGLLIAVRRFDPRRRVKIETYVRHRIRGAMLDALRQIDPVSRDLRQKSRKAERICEHLQNELGRAAGADEMAAALGASLPEWHAMLLKLNGADLAWTRPYYIPEVRSVMEAEPVAGEKHDPYQLCYRSEQRDLIERACLSLPRREAMVLKLCYEREMTMKEAGREMGIKESRVSQIHRDAIARLRSQIRRMPGCTAAPAIRSDRIIGACPL